MTPTDIIDIAVQKAKADLLYELEYRGFIYESPMVDVNDELVQDFAQHCLTHIGRLCTDHAKEFDECLPVCNIRTDLYRIEVRDDVHVLRYRGYMPIEIKKVPHDIESILTEFGRRTSYFRRMVEDVNWDFVARCKASEIAKNKPATILTKKLNSYENSLLTLAQGNCTASPTAESEPY